MTLKGIHQQITTLSGDELVQYLYGSLESSGMSGERDRHLSHRVWNWQKHFSSERPIDVIAQTAPYALIVEMNGKLTLEQRVQLLTPPQTGSYECVYGDGDSETTPYFQSSPLAKAT